MLKILFPLISLFLLVTKMKQTKNILPLLMTAMMLLTPTTLMLRLDQMVFFTSSWKMDMLSVPLVTLTIWITAMMVLASNKTYYDMDRLKTFSIMILLLSMTLLVAFMSNSLFNFFIFFEASLIPTLFLILGWGYQPERLQAGVYLMMYTITASLPLLMMIATMMHLNNHNNMLFLMAPPTMMSHTPEIYVVVLIAAFMVKMPLYFVHLWLPKAHVEAPVAGSMILAGLLLKLGSYGLIRIMLIQPNTTQKMKEIFLPVSLVGAIITSLICIRQTDMKSLIAYSSVGHMALLVAGALSSTTWGMEGALVLMLAHGLCSSGLFFLAYATYTTTKSRSTLMVKGILNFFPALTMFWFLFSIFNMAAPPSINLLSEIMLISSVLSSSMYTLTTLMLISFTAAVYSLVLYTSLNHGYPTQTSNPMNHFMSSFYMTMIMHITPMMIMVANPTSILSSAY